MGALFAFGWAFYQVGSLAHENRGSVKVTTAAIAAATSPTGAGLPTLFNEARDVTVALLRPCKPGNPASCGLIPAIRQVATDTSSTTAAIGQQIAQTQPLIQNAASAVSDTSTHVNQAVDAMTAATDQARADLVTLNTPIAAAGPLLVSYTRAGDSLNALLQRKAITQMMDDWASMSHSGAGILADGQKVSDKISADYLDPKPWWKKVGRYAGDAADVAGGIGRALP